MQIRILVSEQFLGFVYLSLFTIEDKKFKTKNQKMRERREREERD